MSTYYVYQLRLDNSELPFYIGKGVGDRAYKHLMPCHLKHRSHKNHTILKAMRDGVRIVVEIIHQNLTEHESLDLELKEIAKYGRTSDGGCLTNITLGGMGTPGWTMPQGIRDKISAANRGKKRTAETRKRMSIAFKGRKLSPEHVESIRQRNTGKKASDETKAKMSAARIGKKRPEHGAKVSAALMGKKHTPERTKAVKFGNWDTNPAWKSADAIYEVWSNTGKPGRIRLQKMMPDVRLGSMHTQFAKGWNPSNDETWKEYAVPLDHAFGIDHVGETAEPVHVLESHLGTNEIFHAIPVVGNDKNVQVL